MSFWSQRRVLVTGCTGFLGGWLTDELVRREAKVVGLVRNSVPQAPFYLSGIDRKISTVQGAVEDYAVLERTLAEYGIDTVFHLAAQAIVTVANRNPMSTFETNIRGTWTLLEACRRHGGISRVVVASSDKAYGDLDRLPYAEDHPMQGRHPYDVSKSCADLISISYHHTYGLPVCVTRCGNIFGPRDLNFSRIVPGTIQSALMNERPVIRSDGSPIRDYVFVKDIVRAYLLLAEHMEDASVVGQAYNFGTGEPMSVLELTRTILARAGREHLVPLVLNQGKGEIQHEDISSELAARVLGWKPGAPVADRLGETIAWYRSHLEAISNGGTSPVTGNALLADLAPSNPEL